MTNIGTYASLVNQKILIPEGQGTYVRVEQHFLLKCLLPLLQEVRVDDRWYLSAYPDVQEAVKQGVVPDARTHYCYFGFYEHRMPYRIAVHETWYLTEYADVRAAVANGLFASGQAHFELDGFREGRIPYAGFQLESTGEHRLNDQLNAADKWSQARNIREATRITNLANVAN